MHQARQGRQQLGPVRGLALDVVLQRQPAELLVHPAFQVGQGGLPQIEFGIELAAEALDVEQGLLQQHQLRLDFHIELARGLEQAQQHAAQRNLLERPVEEGFADGTDCRLELVDAGFLGCPAGFDVHFGDALVIALEEGQEILRQIVLVDIGQGADDAEVQRDVAAAVRPFGGDENVAGMHVGVEEAVAEHLGEKYFDAGAGQARDVHAFGAQRIDLRNRRAVHALHDHHAGGAPVPIHLGQDQQVGALEIAPQLRAVGRLAHQVQFVVQILVELGHHLARLQAPAVGPEGFQQAGGDLQQRDVMLDHRLDAGAQDLDRDLASVRQHREMHLGYRGRGHRLALEGGEHLIHRLAIGLFQFGDGQLRGKRRHAILQPGQFVGDVQRQQVAPRG